MTTILFIALAVCWGSAFLATKNIVDSIDPMWGAFSRVFFGFIFLTALFAIRRKSIKVPTKELWKPWVLSLLLIALPFIFMFWGQQYIPSGVAGIFNATVPLWVFLIAAVTLKGEDAFNWRRAVGVLIGLGGIFFIMYPKLHFSGSMSEFYGCGALLLMAVCYALGNVGTKYVMVDHKTISIEGNVFQQYLFSAVLLLALSLAFGTMPTAAAFTPKVIISMIVVGVFSSAVAYLILVELIKRLGALRASAVTYLVPLVALSLDFAATGRIPLFNEIGGVLLIFFSLFLIQKPLKK
ncbi:drug/metabolite transporter (DMT)-like permease [Elusimicrobium simillimum]|uniref:DMT family transporter n=1 Tax=Elusimicrobium simillimum TaxID=3143438 RepID=UPI003C6FBB9B